MIAEVRHALIIEDEMIIALEVEDLLSELGFSSFDIADSPAQAVAAAVARRPDLVTADYRIIGGTGLEAVAGIVGAIGLVPVVYITGNPDVVLKQGLKPVVDKPISRRALAEACRQAQPANP
jgi:CheY-like chemotaxis protein